MVRTWKKYFRNPYQVIDRGWIRLHCCCWLPWQYTPNEGQISTGHAFYMFGLVIWEPRFYQVDKLGLCEKQEPLLSLNKWVNKNLLGYHVDAHQAKDRFPRTCILHAWTGHLGTQDYQVQSLGLCEKKSPYWARTSEWIRICWVTKVMHTSPSSDFLPTCILHVWTGHFEPRAIKWINWGCWRNLYWAWASGWIRITRHCWLLWQCTLFQGHLFHACGVVIWD